MKKINKSQAWRLQLKAYGGWDDPYDTYQKFRTITWLEGEDPSVPF